MNIFTYSQKTYYTSVVATIFCVFFLFFLSIYISPNKYSIKSNNSLQRINLKNEWHYRWDAASEASTKLPLWAFDEASPNTWQAFNYPGTPARTPLNNGNVVWVKKALPDGQWEDPCIYLKSDDQVFEAYLGGKLIYRYGELCPISQLSPPGSPWHMIALPDDFNGKILTLRMQSTVKSSTGRITGIFLGERAALVSMIVKDSSFSIILSILFIFIGFGILVFLTLHKRRRHSFLRISFFSIIVGLWMICESGIKQLYIDSPLFWFYSAILIFYLMPSGFFLCIEQFFNKKGRKIVRLAYLAHSLFTFIAVLLHITGFLCISHTVMPFYLLVVFTLLSTIIISIRSVLSGNKYPPVILCGIIALSLTAILDIVGWHLNIFPSIFRITYCGMIMFEISIITFIIQSLYRVRKRLSLYSRRVKVKNETLIESRKQLALAEEYDKLKDEFIANISHDFRTPINNILGSTKLLNMCVNKKQPTGVSIDVRRHTGTVQQNCYRLMRLVNNLIDSAKIDSGYERPCLRNCNIVKIIRETTLLAADYAHSRELKLSFHSNADDIIMACDPQKIERIMTNLLSNAIKFTGTGGTIKVELASNPKNIEITVSDTGIGIPTDKLESIFERFTQISNPYGYSFNGNGIGLSLVRSFVEMHNGSISVESQYQQGSRFCIILPILRLGGQCEEIETSSSLAFNPFERMQIEFSDI